MNIGYGKWDGATTLKFVSLYRSHSCLWDSKSVHYKNQQKRMHAYTALANAMDISGFGIPEVKSKIKNLRSTFSQELKKIRDNDYYEPNLRWFKAMEEIYKEMLLRRQGKGYDGQDGDTTNDTHETDSEELETEMLEEEVFLEEPPASPPKKKTKINLRNPTEFLKISHTDPLNSTIETESSSYDIFGRSVAAQLKNLSARNALLAKSQIQNILTEFGIKDLKVIDSNFGDSVDRKWVECNTESNNFN